LLEGGGLATVGAGEEVDGGDSPGGVEFVRRLTIAVVGGIVAAARAGEIEGE